MPNVIIANSFVNYPMDLLFFFEPNGDYVSQYMFSKGQVELPLDCKAIIEMCSIDNNNFDINILNQCSDILEEKEAKEQLNQYVNITYDFLLKNNKYNVNVYAWLIKEEEEEEINALYRYVGNTEKYVFERYCEISRKKNIIQ